MNKRKKRMPLVEDINLDDIFSEAQKDQILNPKRQRRNHFSKMSSESTDDGDDCVSRVTSNTLNVFEGDKLSSSEKI